MVLTFACCRNSNEYAFQEMSDARCKILLRRWKIDCCAHCALNAVGIYGTVQVQSAASLSEDTQSGS